MNTSGRGVLCSGLFWKIPTTETGSGEVSLGDLVQRMEKVTPGRVDMTSWWSGCGQREEEADVLG